MKNGRIKTFFKNNVIKEDKFTFALLGFTLILAAIYISNNYLFFHFTGDFYVPIMWLSGVPVLAIIMILAMINRFASPKVSFVTITYTTYFFIVVTLGILTTGIQFTPFPLINDTLIQWDQALGFHSIKILNWTYQHMKLHNALDFIYNSLGYELFLMPFIAALFQRKKTIRLYFYALIFSYLIGTTIYYYFPTVGLTPFFHDIHFSQDQQATFLKFEEVHRHLPVTTYEGGMIAFPSFHVIWAILVVFAARDQKWLYYPAIIYNVILICSTVLLGWHYLMDVFAGIIIAGISLSLATLCYKYTSS